MCICCLFMQTEAKHTQCFSTILCFCWNGWQTRKEKNNGQTIGLMCHYCSPWDSNFQGTAPSGSVKQCHSACHPLPYAVSECWMPVCKQASLYAAPVPSCSPFYSLAAVTARLGSLLCSYTSLELALSGLKQYFIVICTWAQKWEQSRRLYVKYHKIQA